MSPRSVVTRGDLPAFVKFPISGQIGFRHDAEHAPAMDDERRIVEPAGMAQRRAHDQHGQQLSRGLDQTANRLFHRIQHRILEQQILDRIAGQGQFREHRHRHAALVAIARGGQHGIGIAGRIRQRRLDGAGGHTGEPLGVKGIKFHSQIMAPMKHRKKLKAPPLPTAQTGRFTFGGAVFSMSFATIIWRTGGRRAPMRNTASRNTRAGRLSSV